MGWRTTAQNLTSIATTQRCPEIRRCCAWATGTRSLSDLHVTDGAQSSTSLAQRDADAGGDEELRRAGVGLRDELMHDWARRALFR